MKQLAEFFALVEGGSVYRVFVMSHRLLAHRIAGERRLFSGTEPDICFSKGRVVGITKESGLVFFDPALIGGVRDAEGISEEDDLDERTTPIIALFLDKVKALDHRLEAPFERWDKRWRSEVQAVLRAIEDAHPYFSRSRSVVDSFVN